MSIQVGSSGEVVDFVYYYLYLHPGAPAQQIATDRFVAMQRRHRWGDLAPSEIPYPRGSHFNEVVLIEVVLIHLVFGRTSHSRRQQQAA